MGFALADEAARRGADVTVVAANVDLARRPGVSYVDVETTAELAEACGQRFAEADVLLMAAAPADYRPAERVEGKISKDRSATLEVALERTDDVLAGLSAARSPGQTVVGFAAEHGEGAAERGRHKLEAKGLDAVVVNDISRAGIGFDAADNEVTVVTDTGQREVPRGSKAEVAGAVLDEVERLRYTPLRRGRAH